ncbi:unnamed protein product [Withania somnifera]
MQSNFSAKARSRSAAYKAASSSGVPESLKDLCEFWKEEGVTPIDNRGDTILHFLAVNGNVAGFEILEPLNIKDLETRNNSGDTPLHEAARFGKKDMVERILRIEKDLVYAKNNLGETPLYVAASSEEKDVFAILANCDFSKLTMKRNDGKTVLHATVANDCYGIPPRYKESNLSDNQTQTGTKVVHVDRFPFTKSLLGNSWLQAIDETKQKHILALILAKMLLEKYNWSYTDHILPNPRIQESKPKTDKSEGPNPPIQESKSKTDESVVPNPLIQASKHKIDELVVEILEKYPEVVETLDEEGRNIFHIAAEHKNRFEFDYLLKNVASKNRMLADIDKYGNTVLHYAANVGTPFFTSTTEHIESVWCVMSVLMMMWGVLWFKYIKYNMHPRLWDVKNAKGLKAEEMFETYHLHVRKEAETAVRNLSNSTLVLSTLLCTINFAAIFTVPGGFEEKTGLPILLDKVQQELWMLMFYLGAALFSSVFTMAFTILACLQALNLENIFLNKDVWWLIIAVVAVGFIMTLIYVDLAFPVFDYMYYLVSYSFFVPYKRGRL